MWVSLSCLVFADSSPSHSSATSHTLPPFPDADDEFSDFVQGPVDASSSFPSSSLPPSSPSRRAAHISQALVTGPVQHPLSSPLPHSVPSSLPVSPAIQHSSVISSSQSAFQGNAPLMDSHFAMPSLVSTHNQWLDAITTLLGVQKACYSCFSKLVDSVHKLVVILNNELHLQLM